MTGLLSPLHIAIVVIVVLIVFGGRKLPELGRLTGTRLRAHFLDRPAPQAPAALPEAPPPGPGTHPVLASQARPPAVNDALRAQAKRHVARTVLRRVPGPIGWIARLLVR